MQKIIEIFKFIFEILKFLIKIMPKSQKSQAEILKNLQEPSRKEPKEPTAEKCAKAENSQERTEKNQAENKETKAEPKYLYNLILIERKAELEKATMGKLKIYDKQRKIIFESDTLEPKGESTNEPNKNKRILATFYDLQWKKNSQKNKRLANTYPKFKNEQGNTALKLCLNPNFNKREILIHSGNTADETKGCILVGKWENEKQAKIINSIETTKNLYNKILKLNINETKLIINEAKILRDNFEKCVKTIKAIEKTIDYIDNELDKDELKPSYEKKLYNDLNERQEKLEKYENLAIEISKKIEKMENFTSNQLYKKQ